MDRLNRQYHFKFFKCYFLNFTWFILGYFDPYYTHILYKQFAVDKASSLIGGEVAWI